MNDVLHEETCFEIYFVISNGLENRTELDSNLNFSKRVEDFFEIVEIRISLK